MRIPITGLSSLGMISDQSPHELPLGAFSYLRNMRVQDGALESAEGHVAALSPPSVAPIFLQAYAGVTDYAWLYASATKVYVYQGGAHYNLTRQTLGVDVDYTGTRWCGCALSGVPVLTNEADVPQMWDANTASRCVDLPNWPAANRARIIRPFKNHLVALDITKTGTRYPFLVHWSHPADPGTVPASWDIADPTKDSGEFPLAETGGALIDCAPIRDTNIIYKEDAAYAMQYVGGSSIFGFRLLSTEIGMLTANAMCAYGYRGPKHCVFTPSDVVVFDGNSFETLLTERLRKWLFTTIDYTDLSKTTLRHNMRKQEIWICFSANASGRLDTVLIWNYARNAFTVRDLPQLTALELGLFSDAGAGDTWAGDTETWAEDTSTWGSRAYSSAVPQLLGASDDPSAQWYLFDQGATFNGSAITSVAEREGLTVVGVDPRSGAPIQDSESVKLLTEVWPRIQAASSMNIDIYVGSQMQRDDAVTWSGPFAFDPTTDRKINPLVSGKILSIRFQTSSTIKWKLFGYDLEIKKVGGY